jgi:hypothetical protein
MARSRLNETAMGRGDRQAAARIASAIEPGWRPDCDALVSRSERDGASNLSPTKNHLGTFGT